jgi:hypothetical protein
MIAGGVTDDPGHADIVRIVIFDEVLAAGRMGQGREQPRGRGDHFVMRTLAAGASIDRDRITLVEDGSNLIEVCVTRTQHRSRNMHRVWKLVVRSGIGDVGGHDEHRDAAPGQRSLAGSDRLAPSLLGRNDHLAEHATTLEHVVEIDLLD